MLNIPIDKPLNLTRIQGDESLDDLGVAQSGVVQRLRGRDPDAFDRMVDEQSPKIESLVNRLLGFGCAHDVDDVVQEVFVRAWKKIHTWRGDAKLSTWLHSIAINVCRNHYRKHRLKRAFLGRLHRNDDEAQQAESHEDPSAVQEEVRTAISKLSMKDREVIVLRCMEERPAEEVARLLGVSAGTVDVRLHRAKRRLKAVLELRQ